jgi:hypothetical protein
MFTLVGGVVSFITQQLVIGYHSKWISKKTIQGVSEVMVKNLRMKTTH